MSQKAFRNKRVPPPPATGEINAEPLLKKKTPPKNLTTTSSRKNKKAAGRRTVKEKKDARDRTSALASKVISASVAAPSAPTPVSLVSPSTAPPSALYESPSAVNVEAPSAPDARGRSNSGVIREPATADPRDVCPKKAIDVEVSIGGVTKTISCANDAEVSAVVELMAVLKLLTISVKQFATALNDCRSYRELLHTIEPNLLSINDNLTQWNRTNNRRARDAAASRSQEESDARDAKLQRLVKGLHECIQSAERTNKRAEKDLLTLVRALIHGSASPFSMFKGLALHIWDPTLLLKPVQGRNGFELVGQDKTVLTSMVRLVQTLHPRGATMVASPSHYLTEVRCALRRKEARNEEQNEEQNEEKSKEENEENVEENAEGSE